MKKNIIIKGAYMIIRTIARASLGLVLCFTCLCSLSTPVFGVRGYEQIYLNDGGGSSSSSNSPDICPPGSLHYGKENSKITSLAQCNLPLEDDDDQLMNRVQVILNVVVSVIGIVSVAVIILGGVYYVISQGEAAKITKAKNTILYGVVGLIVAMLAFAIISFVLSSISS